MSYVDGFVSAVPTASKRAFIEHARKANGVFIELGALRIRECWGDEVPTGERTDFQRAVQAGEDETVVFSFVEWPDKATREAAWAKMGELSKTDARVSPEANPMPFDGARMIYGGFAPVVMLGEGGEA